MKEKGNFGKESVNGEQVLTPQVFTEDQFQQRIHREVEELNTDLLFKKNKKAMTSHPQKDLAFPWT